MNENYIRDLNLTTDVVQKLGDAFSDGKFRELLGQYLREINDPNYREVFENEIIQLERERGNEAQFVKPKPGYVLKTSADGSQKVYVNICSSENIGEAQYVSAIKDKVHGKNVLIPHALSPVQNIYNKYKKPVSVYTVIFHPATLEKAQSNTQIKQLVNETALTFIEKSFDIILDKVNFCVSKKLFKGAAQLTTVRKQNANIIEKPTRELEDTGNSNEYVKPVHRIKYRNEVDIQDSTMDRFCKLNALVPKEMIIEIELPLLKSTQNTHLDVQTHSVTLLNEIPKYKTNIDLPYEVSKDCSTAKFDSVTRILRIELRVLKKNSTSLDPDISKPALKLVNEINNALVPANISSNEVSNGCSELNSSGFSSFPSTSGDESSDTNSKSKKLTCSQFLHPNVKYKLPLFDCNFFQHKLAFTIHVKNVNFGSFDFRIFDKRDGFWVKFCSLGAGHFPMFFAMCVVFKKDEEIVTSLNYSVEDGKVYVYVKLRNDFVPLEYLAGVDRCSLEKHYLNEPDAVVLEFEHKTFLLSVTEAKWRMSKIKKEYSSVEKNLEKDKF